MSVTRITRSLVRFRDFCTRIASQSSRQPSECSGLPFYRGYKPSGSPNRSTCLFLVRGLKLLFQYLRQAGERLSIGIAPGGSLGSFISPKRPPFKSANLRKHIWGSKNDQTHLALFEKSENSRLRKRSKSFFGIGKWSEDTPDLNRRPLDVVNRRRESPGTIRMAEFTVTVARLTDRSSILAQADLDRLPTLP